MTETLTTREAQLYAVRFLDNFPDLLAKPVLEFMLSRIGDPDLLGISTCGCGSWMSDGPGLLAQAILKRKADSHPKQPSRQGKGEAARQSARQPRNRAQVERRRARH